jgi:hypothetical protein
MDVLLDQIVTYPVKRNCPSLAQCSPAEHSFCQQQQRLAADWWSVYGRNPTCNQGFIDH